jgi:hypothetical protein
MREGEAVRQRTCSSVYGPHVRLLRCRGIHGDKGYRGHTYPDRFKVWISGQIRRVTRGAVAPPSNP